MDVILFILQVVVLLGAIFLGVRLGGIGIGFAGGLGVVVLTLILDMKVGSIPWDVILIIMSVIAAISAMQLAGGLDYLVQIAERILRANPKYINYLAPTVTYFLTILAGTGHTAFSMIPVIVEVAKEQNIKPSAPLSIAVVSSQIAITASPVSAAVVYMTGVLEPLGWSYPLLLLIWIVTTFVGCMLTAFIISTFSNLDLSKDPVYQERLKAGLVKPPVGAMNIQLKDGAKLSVLIFLIGVLCVVLYATSISNVVRDPMLEYVNGIIAAGSSLAPVAEFVKSYIDPIRLPRDSAIMSFMLAIATLIVMCCKLNTGKIFEQSVFKSGMVACVCVLGVAWLGDTFVAGYKQDIQDIAGDLAKRIPALVAVAFFFASMLLYSQAATAKAIVPTIIAALGITAMPDGSVAANSYILVASFAAVSALFVLPTYPTLLGAVQMDDTGTTRIGKYVFNHAFLVPGVLAIALSVAFGFLVASLF